MRFAERAALDLVYARAAMDLRTARRERDRLALKIARDHMAGRKVSLNDERMFARAERNVPKREVALDKAAEDCDAAFVGQKS